MQSPVKGQLESKLVSQSIEGHSDQIAPSKITLNAIYWYNIFYGMICGLYLSVIPMIKTHHGLSNLTLGLSLLIGLLGVVSASPMAKYCVRKFGSGRSVIFGTTVLSYSVYPVSRLLSDKGSCPLWMTLLGFIGVGYGVRWMDVCLTSQNKSLKEIYKLKHGYLNQSKSNIGGILGMVLGSFLQTIPLPDLILLTALCTTCSIISITLHFWLVSHSVESALVNDSHEEDPSKIVPIDAKAQTKTNEEKKAGDSDDIAAIATVLNIEDEDEDVVDICDEITEEAISIADEDKEQDDEDDLDDEDDDEDLPFDFVDANKTIIHIPSLQIETSHHMRSIRPSRMLVNCLCLLAAISNYIYSSIGLWSVIYLSETFHLSPLWQGLGYVCFQISWIIGSSMAEYLFMRISRRRVLQLSSILVAIGASMLLSSPSLSSKNDGDIVLVLVGYAISGLGCSLTWPSVMSIGSSIEMPSIKTDIIVSNISMFSNLGYVLCPVVVGGLSVITVFDKLRYTLTITCSLCFIQYFVSTIIRDAI